jgi:hypothetical protein
MGQYESELADKTQIEIKEMQFALQSKAPIVVDMLVHAVTTTD